MNQKLEERVSANPITEGILSGSLTKIDVKQTMMTLTILRQNAPLSPLVTQLYIDQPRGGPPSDRFKLNWLANMSTLLLQRLNSKP